MSGSAPPESVEDDSLVSVFIPAYNASAFIEQTLSSVLAQSYRNIEIVVLDDASTDDTPQRVAGFVDPRLRYVRNARNLGQFRTMSRAAELTRGPFIAICHADDVYEPDSVATELAFLRRHPEAGAVFAQDNIIDEEGRLLARVTIAPEFVGRPLLGYEEIFRYLLRNMNQLLCCPTFMVRREVLLKVGAFDGERYRIAADLDMWIRILRCHPVGVLPERLVNYRRSREQQSSKYQRLRTTQDEFFAIMDRYRALDGLDARLTLADRREYEFHRFDDNIFRAANLVILGRPDEARPLFARGYPWISLLRRPRRRKVRVLLVQSTCQLMLWARQAAILVWLLRWSEYGDRTGVSADGPAGL